MRQENILRNNFKVLSCVLYTIISNYVCTDYLACGPKIPSELPFGNGRGLNMETTVMKKYW